MTASWSQLWDQYDAIAFHTQKGIEFLEKYGAFLKERSTIEDEYAAKLRALAKKYGSKKKEEVENQFSYARAFLGVLQELGDLAGQHEVVAETYRQEALRDIATTSKDVKEQRKLHLSEAARLQQNLDYTIGLMFKAQKEYNKTFKEAEAAQLKYVKAEGNMDLSRAELEKTKSNSLLKSRQSEDAKNAYALQLQKANELQSAHYSLLLPAVLEKLRLMDEMRIAHIQRLIERCVSIEESSLPIIQRCLYEMKNTSSKIDPGTDSQLVVDRYRSGYAPPQDFPFEDLGSPLASAQEQLTNGPPMVNGSGNDNTLVRPEKSRRSNRTIGRSQSGRGKIGKMLFGGHKSVDYQEDYSDLPPSQRCQKLTKKIMAIENEIYTKTQSRDGLLKMANVYRENPKMGDLAQVESQLGEYNQELDALSGELNKFRTFLAEANSQMNVPISAVGTPSPRRPERTPPSSSRNSNSLPMGTKAPQRSSMSEESISSEGSSALSQQGHTSTPLSVNGQQRSPSRTNVNTVSSNNHGSSISPESGIGESSQMLSYADEQYDQTTVDGELYIEPDNSVIMGTCTAMYTFDGGSDGTIAIRDGEELLLLEKDDGDGWTRVKRQHSSEEGFVPTSYLECKWSSISPESGIGESSQMLSYADEQYDQTTVDGELYIEPDNSVIMGTCTAMYTFDGGSDGTIAIRDGEELLLLEKDDGDGWTRVKRQHSSEEGFVPTSYLECKWYPIC